MKYEIGQQLATDNSSIENTISFIKTRVLTPLGNVIKEHRKLDLGKFTEEDLQNVLTGNSSEIEGRFIKKATGEAARIGKSITMAIESDGLVSKSLVPFKKSVESLRNTINVFSQFQSDFQSGDIKISSGKPVIQVEEIRSRHTVVIESDEEAEFFNRLQALKKSYDHVREFANDHGMQQYLIVSEEGHLDALTIVGEDGYLVTSHDNILLLRRLKGA